MIHSFKGRKLDRKKPVRVYRNLHKRQWSISQGGRVVAHADTLVLQRCAFVVSVAGWKRSVKIKQRTVHAFVTGSLRRTKPPYYDCHARYNRDVGQFETAGWGPAQRPLSKADVIQLDDDGRMKIVNREVL